MKHSLAYKQIEIDEDSNDCITINTHKGLYMYNSLPLGLHSTTALFQKTMEGLLRGIPQVAVYM